MKLSQLWTILCQGWRGKQFYKLMFNGKDSVLASMWSFASLQLLVWSCFLQLPHRTTTQTIEQMVHQQTNQWRWLFSCNCVNLIPWGGGLMSTPKKGRGDLRVPVGYSVVKKTLFWCFHLILWWQKHWSNINLIKYYFTCHISRHISYITYHNSMQALGSGQLISAKYFVHGNDFTDCHGELLHKIFMLYVWYWQIPLWIPI